MDMNNNYVERRTAEIYAVRIGELDTDMMNKLSKRMNIDIGIQSRIENGLITLHLGKETETVGHNDYLIIDGNGISVKGMTEFEALYVKL